MKINRETYEQIFIKYLEGDLTDTEIKKLILFLDKNPDLQRELQEITSYAKNKEVIETEFSIKDSLKKKTLLQNNKSNFDELCIAFYEDLLSEKEENILLSIIDNSQELNKEFHLYGMLKYKPDLSVTFPNKEKLLKKQRKMFPAYLSSAASIILIVSFVFYWASQNSKPITKSKTEIAKESSYKQLNVGFSKKTEKKYQAIVSTPKQETKKQIKIKKQFRITRTLKTNKQQALYSYVKNREIY